MIAKHVITQQCIRQSSPHDVTEADGTTNLAPPQFDDATLYIEESDSDGAE
jgi:hypothetical protein